MKDYQMVMWMDRWKSTQKMDVLVEEVEGWTMKDVQWMREVFVEESGVSGGGGGENIMKGGLELPLKVTVAINSSSYHLKGGRKMLYIWY